MIRAKFKHSLKNSANVTDKTLILLLPLIYIVGIALITQLIQLSCTYPNIGTFSHEHSKCILLKIKLMGVTPKYVSILSDTEKQRLALR